MRPRTAHLKYERRGGRDSAEPSFVFQASNREGGLVTMSSVSGVVRRHPIITFFALTYAIGWGLIPFWTFQAGSPFIAALIVIPLTQGVAGLKELGLRMIRWRVRWYWYVVAIALPLASVMLTAGLNVALGASAPSLASYGSVSSVLLFFVIRLVNPGDGAL